MVLLDFVCLNNYVDYLINNKWLYSLPVPEADITACNHSGTWLLCYKLIDFCYRINYQNMIIDRWQRITLPVVNCIICRYMCPIWGPNGAALTLHEIFALSPCVCNVSVERGYSNNWMNGWWSHRREQEI